MKLPKNVRRQLAKSKTRGPVEGMSHPHEIRLYCTGTQSRPHNTSTVARVWVDADTGEYRPQETGDGVVQNLQNGDYDGRRPPAYEQREAEHDGSALGGVWQELMDMQTQTNTAPSFKADRIYCHRCKRTIQRKADDLSKVYLIVAALGHPDLDIAHLEV